MKLLFAVSILFSFALFTTTKTPRPNPRHPQLTWERLRLDGKPHYRTLLA